MIGPGAELDVSRELDGSLAVVGPVAFGIVSVDEQDAIVTSAVNAQLRRVGESML
jgi:hypothetical protein